MPKMLFFIFKQVSMQLIDIYPMNNWADIEIKGRVTNVRAYQEDVYFFFYIFPYTLIFEGDKNTSMSWIVLIFSFF